VIAAAKLKYLGVSAQKTRLVVDQVRGVSVESARSILRYSPKRVARDVYKLMESAVHNAQQKDQAVDVDRLVISRATVDDAPPLKRARSASMGRVFRVLKRSCHVTLELDMPARPARKPAPARTAGKPAPARAGAKPKPARRAGKPAGGGR
jgi:large subunit ribosomal protein L22